ncbi:MAG: tRNA 2-thiouridine(34) synthase MnmA [Acidimicrobiia bacterium]
MRVLAALSGGVDSSVAAALLLEEGHEVVAATMKLWGGASDSGCCSVADVDDARRAAQQLGIDHHVFNFTDDFDAHVVDPYVSAHAAGRTPNPCVECNRHLKFDRFLRRAEQLGFDAVATGHHARVDFDGRRWSLRRSVDAAKDQSYVLHMLGQRELAQCMFPIGSMTKADVRDRAAALGLRTAAKPDSQDVCFIMATQGGREAFLGDRIPLRPARMVDSRSGREIGSLASVELVTVGQRRGLGSGAGGRRYVVDVDVESATVYVGPHEDVLRPGVAVESMTWVHEPIATGVRVLVQSSAHGRVVGARWSGDADAGVVDFDEPQRAIAPGQSVVLYEADRVIGGGIATR